MLAAQLGLKYQEAIFVTVENRHCGNVHGVLVDCMVLPLAEGAVDLAVVLLQRSL